MNIEPLEIKKIYEDLANRKYVRNPNSISNNSIINKYLAPINIPESQHPFAYIFKNAIIEILRLSNFNIKADFMTQLNLIILASTAHPEKDNDVDIEIILYKSPVPGDINYQENRVFNVVNRKDYRNENQYLQWLDFDEICVAYLNGMPYFITRVFLQSVMNLRNNQTFEDYFNTIGIKYKKISTYNTGIVFFQQLCSTMVGYRFASVNGNSETCINILDTGRALPLLTNEYIEVYMIKRGKGYYLDTRMYMFKGNTSDFGNTGLLANLGINNIVKDTLQIDPVTANTIISYMYQEEDRFLEEGEDLIYHILAYYPRLPKEDIYQNYNKNS